MSDLRKNILTRLVPFALIVFAWFNPYYSSSLQELEKASEEALASLAIVEELYLFSEAASSVKLPLISGTFEGAAQSLDKVVGYLSIASIAVVANTMIIKITHYKLVVVGLLVLWLISLRTNWKKSVGRVLMIGLFLNPGLSVFTHVIHYIDEQVKISPRGEMKSQLELIHKDVSKKEKARIKKHEARTKRHQERRAARESRDNETNEGRREIRREERKDRRDGSSQILGQNLEPHPSDTVGLASSEHHGIHLAEDFKLTKRAIKYAAKKVRALVVNFFTSILFMNILLPIGYLMILYLMIKTAFGFSYHRGTKSKVPK